jgi:hypothetical protein
LRQPSQGNFSTASPEWLQELKETSIGPLAVGMHGGLEQTRWGNLSDAYYAQALAFAAEATAQADDA